MEVDVLDYMGKVTGAVIVSIAVMYEENYYAGLYMYNDVMDVLEMDDNFKLFIGLDDIDEWEGFDELIGTIQRKVLPYKEISVRIDDIDLSGLKLK